VVSESERERHIVAVGGAGFSAEPDNFALERYAINLTGKERPRVCFIPTASGDSQDYINRYNAASEQLPWVPSLLSLFRGENPDLASVVLNQDIIYVGGGNTRNMLVLWREWGLDALIREAWERGIVMTGVSAGSICWFEQGVTDSIPGSLNPLPCLGFLPGSQCPHYDSEVDRQPSYTRFVGSGEMLPGYATDDGVALHYVGTHLERIISSRPAGRAYRVERDGNQATEAFIAPDYLADLVEG
jgi:dipeptidase E